MATRSPAAYFAQHPRIYQASVGLTGSALASAVRRAVAAPTRRRRIAFVVLCLVFVVELIGLARIRPPEPAKA